MLKGQDAAPRIQPSDRVILSAQREGPLCAEDDPKTTPPAIAGGRRGWVVHSVRVTVVEASSDAGYVRYMESFLTGPDLELDFLTFRKRFEPIHRDGGEVHKDVLAAVLFDEAIAFGVIEPLHLPSGHARCLQQSESILHCVPGKPRGLRGPI
jgi:hypothetical protein